MRSLEIGLVLNSWRSNADPTTLGWGEIHELARCAEACGAARRGSRSFAWRAHRLPSSRSWTATRCPALALPRRAGGGAPGCRPPS